MTKTAGQRAIKFPLWKQSMHWVAIQKDRGNGSALARPRVQFGAPRTRYGLSGESPAQSHQKVNGLEHRMYKKSQGELGLQKRI